MAVIFNRIDRVKLLSGKKNGLIYSLRRCAALAIDGALRLAVFAATRLLYRMEVSGVENLPKGPALLVSNHISYVDALLLIAAQRRRIHFLMTREIYEGWALLTPVFRAMGCIPIEMSDPPKKIIGSLRQAREWLDEGGLVCIFAEGTLTRIGMLREFRKGFTKIVKNSSHPIVPVYIGGAWGTITSHYHGKFILSWRGWPRDSVSVLFGKPLPSGLEPAEVRLAVMELSCDYFEGRKAGRGGLAREFIRTARRNRGRAAVADSAGRTLTYGACLERALALAGPLGKKAADQRNVGVLLPLSAGGALANLAAVLAGKVPVNLNYTLSEKALRASIEQCGISTIITSRGFVRAENILLPANSALYVEDKAGGGLLSMLKARFAPAALLAGREDPDAAAAVVFTSGASGPAKAVMLSHQNILAGVESLRIIFDLGNKDGICSALPLFHPLGCAASLWYPLLSGVPAYYHSNPLDVRAIARLARENGATVLFTTPALLRLYTRRTRKEDLATLRYVIAGGKKLPPALAGLFEDKFGLRPLEAYGSAEVSPAAALSVPHFNRAPNFQSGWKEGSAGLPAPGVAMKVEDPVTGKPLPAGQEGELLIKGPAVMKGYLGRPELTAYALRGGWYHTGDAASIDEEGFIHVSGRLKPADRAALPRAAVS